MKIIHLEKCTSTNDVAKEILNNKTIEPPPVLIIAEKQTKGRGRSGNWWSPEGAGLYMSVIRHYRKKISHKKAQDLEIHMDTISRKLRTLLSNYFKLHIESEHTLVAEYSTTTNDIYLADKKLAGILCEVHPSTNKLIVGIGLNLFRPTKVTKALQNKAVWLNEYAAECRINKLKLAEMIAEEILKI